ncbi:MAG: TonB family protein [Terracidiphilus sp.]
MRVNKALLLALTIPALILAVRAQNALTVDEQTLEQHVDQRVAPVYPPIAKVARIAGTVIFNVVIGTTGEIESMKVVSGPAMLQQAAIDCLKQWTFKSFVKDGTPTEATGRLSIIFDLGKDNPTPQEEEIASRYFPLSDKCRKAVSARTDTPGAEVVCKQAAETAEEFGPDVRFIEKRSAFVYAATACANNRDLPSALAWAEKAVEVDKLGHDDNSGENAVYSTRGTIEGMMGDLAASDRDLSLAEDYGRKAIAWAKESNFEHGNYYEQTLSRDLRFHAQVLQAMDRPEDAQKKLDEAASLK